VGRTATWLFNKACNIGPSLTLAAVTTAASGTPLPSLKRWSLTPALALSVGLGPHSFSPQWRPHVSPIAGLPLPINAVCLLVQIQTTIPERLKHLRFFPLSKTVINGLPWSKLHRHGTPWRTCPKNVEHPIQERSIIGSWSSALIAWRGWRNQSFELRPQIIRYFARCRHDYNLSRF